MGFALINESSASVSTPTGRTTVRPAVEQDRLAVFKLCAAMHAETDFRYYQFDPEMAIHGVGMWLGHDPSRVLYLAERNGEIAGMLGTLVSHPWFGPEVTLRDEIFYVAPKHRGGRAAYLLMKKFFERAQEVGAKHLMSGNTSGVSEAAERLYAHFGMKRTGGNYCLHT
jgi:GNAT superfamily N-acetyltransferase